MVTVILSHEVKDFAKWKEGFDSGEAMRAGNGIKTTGVFAAADNDNHVTILTEFPSAEAVQGFLANPDLQASMEEAGVVGKPDIKILKAV